MELWERFTGRARRAVLLAHDAAKKAGAAQISTEHLLLGLLDLKEGVAAEVLEGMGVEGDKLRAELRQRIEANAGTEKPGDEPSFTPDAQRALKLTFAEAKRLGHNYIGTEHVLIGLVREGHGLAYRLLRNYGVDLTKVRQSVAGHPSAASATQHQAKSKTPTLDHFSRDLTAEAREGKLDPVIGREEETERVIQILSRRTKNNPCLIGEPGVGKTAIVEGLAQRIIAKEVPEGLLNQRVVALDLASIVAGTKYRGEFEERMKRIIEEISAHKNEIIVFLDELHTLVGTGAAEGAMDASNILKPALARGELRCIGATTLDEFRKYVEKNGSLERRFQSVIVREPTIEESIQILRGVRSRYEEHHGVVIDNEAVLAAVELSARYIPDRALPDKAIDLIDEAGSRVRLRKSVAPTKIRELDRQVDSIRRRKELAVGNQEFEKAGALRDHEQELVAQLNQLQAEWRAEVGDEELVVTKEDIAEVVSAWTGIPVSSLTEEESTKLLRMEEELHKRVVAQDEAIKTVAKAVRRSRAGIQDPRRPTGSFIFLGPTGVGKTLLARALAEFLFGDEDALIRIDMSEYMEKFAVSRLVGAPPGYVGYEESGQLTEAVRRRPYCVVLFDEIEKAHPEVFSILLQVMEEGRLTDSQGRVVSFRNAVVIMTSNVGARQITEGRKLGFGADEAREEDSGSEAAYRRIKSKVMDELKKTFRPEFLNRVDGVVVFHPLSNEDIEAIVDLEIGRVAEQLQTKGVNLRVTDAVRKALAREGYDPAYGARPLRRAIQHLIEDPLAEHVLSGKFSEGDTIVAELEGDQVKFHTEGAAITA